MCQAGAHDENKENPVIVFYDRACGGDVGIYPTGHKLLIPIIKNKQDTHKWHPACFGGDVGIRTPARAEPAYRISNPDPSTAWVHLHMKFRFAVLFRAFARKTGKNTRKVQNSSYI